ncbi:hypothetical protein JCM8547_003880 [Rhodosporidiobolus lusitaniae]
MPKRRRPTSPPPYNSTPSSSSLPSSMAPTPSRGGGRSGYGGYKRPRGGNSSANKLPPPVPVALPSLPGPLLSRDHVLSTLSPQARSRAGPGQYDKWTENPKGVMSNYAKAIGEEVNYQSQRGRVDGQDVYRVTLVADPSPPPEQPSYGSQQRGAMPPIVTPIVGTGDGPNVKEAEKVAALSACLQLGGRGMFTKSNLPTRTIGLHTPLHAASQTHVPTSSSFPTYSSQSNSTSYLPSQSTYAPQQPLSSSSFSAAPAQSYAGGSAFFDAPGAGGAAGSQSAPRYGAPVQQQQGGQQQQQQVRDTNNGKTVTLGNGTTIGLEEARAFMDYYCAKYNFGRPDLSHHPVPGRQRGQNSWRATLSVAGSKVGVGIAKAKKDSTNKAYLDTALYLESCDPALWDAWTQRKLDNQVVKGKAQANVVFEVREDVEDELREAVHEAAGSELYERAREMVKREHEKAERERERFLAARRGVDVGPSSSSTNNNATTSAPAVDPAVLARRAELRAQHLAAKSESLKSRLSAYNSSSDAALVRLKEQRASLPVTSHASLVLAKIATSPVVVVLAATGSGKTTQLPQLILDDAILAGNGAETNIVCTQPRRIAAISVAERVAKERGESVGGEGSVGYQVRFESKPPKPDGSILFCTTGLFLRRMQADLDRQAGGSEKTGEQEFLDGVTHVCVDEVHERDVDTDLLLFVLRRLLMERRRRGKKEIKVVLMSATIDPRLFTEYFADPSSGSLAPVVEVPGRSFPVEKHWLDSTIQELQALRLAPNRGGWVFQEKSVVPYLQRELVPTIPFDPRTGKPVGEIDDLDMPYPLLALIIAHVLSRSDDGHVLVFLPGWDEIQAVRNLLLDRGRFPLLDIDFNSREYEIHVLHSTIPIVEQQAVFEPPAAGIRRIVLSTNIAETSVTIPDVVFVVDSAKCKEKRYDPERRLSQLVSAWTGTSNVLQRAGRAGRHRPGEYYGIVSEARFAAMDIHQTVEMLRTDLASTAMHVTGLQLPGLSVFDVLSSTIQPPEPQRVHAALETLLHVGAIDADEKLTSLGRVLLQLPVEAAIGKLCLLGSFFRCLDQTLTLAAILTNRDPFLSPPLMKEQADRVKNSWAPQEFRSDAFAILKAYNAWWELQGAGNYVAANNFARENFLSKPTLLLIQKIKDHLVSSLDRAGVLQISGGGASAAAPQPFFRGRGMGRSAVIPAHLNENGHSLPLLSALIAAALAPNFAIRISEKSLRTIQDKSCAIHPSSVNSRKNEKASDVPITSSKQLYAFGEKSKTGAMGGKGEGQTFLRSTTKLDPLGYMLFGAYMLRVSDDGLICDSWLPIVPSSQEGVPALDDVGRLKQILDFSLLRVFEGLGVAISRGRGGRAQNVNGRPRPQQQQQQHQQQNHEVARGRQFDKDDEDEAEADEEAVDPVRDPTLSETEVKDLDRLTSNVVHLLNAYHASLGPNSSRASSRPQTPGLGPNPVPMGQQQYHQQGMGGAQYSHSPAGGISRGPSQQGTPYSSRPPSALGNGGGGAYQQGMGGAQYSQQGNGFGQGGGGSGGNWRRR